MNQDTYELSCIYDSRQSFYRKARVEEKENEDCSYIEKTLISYSTVVARITYEINKGRKFEILNPLEVSNTTIRHIREFMRQNGLSDEAENTKAKLLKEFAKGV